MIINIAFRLSECHQILKKTPSSNKTWTAPIFFMVFHGNLNISYHCTIWRSVWKRKSFLNLFKFIEQCKFFQYKRQNPVRLLPSFGIWVLLNSAAFIRKIWSSNDGNEFANLLPNPTLFSAVFKMLYYIRHLVGFLKNCLYYLW